MKLQVGCRRRRRRRCVSLSLSKLCMAVVVVVWRDTLKTSVCMFKKVPVCTGNMSTCVCTCGRVAGTHGDVLNVHTEGGGGDHRRFCLPKLAHAGLSRVQEDQQRNPCMSPIFSLRTGQEQHVAESSIYSLHLNTLFNSRHMTQKTHTDTQNTPQHTRKEKRSRHETDEERQR